MDPIESRLCDGDDLKRLIASLANQIAGGRRGDAPLRLVGVRTRGVPVARRISEHLKTSWGEDIPVGAVDITLYRDDLGRRQHWPVLKGTDIPFSVDGAEVVVVDDVLYTGRTIRAAMNAVCDLGRPSAVRLAVVIARPGRELPIQADYVGLKVSSHPRDWVSVRVSPVDALDEIVRQDAAGVADGQVSVS